MHTFSLPDKLARAVVIRYGFANVYEYSVSSNVSYNVLPRAGIIYPGLASFHKGGNILETPIQLTVC